MGPKIKDEDFRKVLRQIQECASPVDKAGIIRSEIHVVEDLEDLFQTDCLAGDEYGAVFSTFSEMELAVLGRIMFSETLRNKPLNLAETLMEPQTTEWEWQEQYLGFLRELSAEKLTAVESYINCLM